MSSGLGSSQRPYGGDRRLEIVSGSYTTRPRSPGPPPIQHRPSRLSQRSPPPKPWSFGDPERKRRKRIAKYKVYTVEGNVKASLRKGLRWIQNKCSQIVHGY